MKYEDFRTMMKKSSMGREPVAAPKHGERLEYEDIKDRVFYRIDSIRGNESKLVHSPYISFLDMAITFRWLFEENEEGISSALIEDKHIDYWGITEKEVMEQAIINTPRMFPPKKSSLEEVVTGHRDPDSEHLPIHILSNVIGINGASVVLYDGVLRELFREIGEDFYLLPSSIHEMLALGKSYVCDAGDLYEMVREANNTVVDDRDFLSNSVFYYDHRKDQVFCVPE